MAIVYVKASAYRIHFCYMSKRKAISLMTKSALIEKNGYFIKKIYLFYYICKMSSTTCFQKNRDLILYRAKQCYKNDKERLREKARHKNYKFEERNA